MSLLSLAWTLGLRLHVRAPRQALPCIFTHLYVRVMVPSHCTPLIPSEDDITRVVEPALCEQCTCITRRCSTKQHSKQPQQVLGGSL